MTKSQIDKLGERLKTGNYSDDDLRLLDEYRRSFAEAYEAVIQRIVTWTGIEPTGRRIKSTQSIVAKLQRQSTKLSQIQDIAGCRITVEDIALQDEVVRKMIAAFPEATVVDRRRKPSHGYRAVHVITGKEKSVEIQIRTKLQHLWAQLSEKLSDKFGPTIKYGGGPPEVQNQLLRYSENIAWVDTNINSINVETLNVANDMKGSICRYLEHLIQKEISKDDFSS